MHLILNYYRSGGWHGFQGNLLDTISYIQRCLLSALLLVFVAIRPIIHFSNQCYTRLYHEGIDERLIIERTGHHSFKGIRRYKQTDEQQEKKISNLLQQTHWQTTQVDNHNASIPQIQIQN